MEKLEMQTNNLVNENFEKLKALFPNAITETIDDEGKLVRAIDKDILMQEISTEVVEGREERYQFTWPDKRQAILTANQPISKTLRPCREESVNFDETENLYIEGDNLEVLKLLQETYLGKIKMIFIDPPYNTGSDFVYNDNFSMDKDEYLEDSGQYDEEGNRLEKNLESNGRFHTDWLNMMYPRLKLAKNLLSENGMIFVSIDFNESATLKMMMDEIFGEDNFQREIIWRIGWLSGYKTTAANFIRNHDTILFYSKNASEMKFIKTYINNEDFKPLVKKDKNLTSKFNELNLDKDQQNDLIQFINHDSRPERYAIEDTWNSNEYDDLNSIAIVSYSGEKISKILDINQDFKGQKSVAMLKRLLVSSTEKDDIILDFFSGTASTAHATMQLNSEDGDNRKYIMVQIPEEIEESSEAYEAGYKTICDIGKERIRRVGKKIFAENHKGSDKTFLDIGFRVLKTDSSNMKDVYYAPAQTEQSLLDILSDNIKEDRSPEDLLFQVMLDLGISLSSNIKRELVDDKEIFIVEDGFLIACFDKDITEDIVKSIAKEEPYYAVFRDSSMANDSVANNYEQIFENMSPQTVRKVV
ncbi:site-specific DNA-methyltransferase [Facklamia sp. P13064]|uniref:site-specific DNA-methyltransferase n=1 Tax=Facklamia sp. P13064 TaxID=3421953 RepID=UPI003D179E5F